jgi:hypothetical protein
MALGAQTALQSVLAVVLLTIALRAFVDRISKARADTLVTSRHMTGNLSL